MYYLKVNANNSISLTSFQFQGIKVSENENNWSKNMKQGIASMMQLDLSRIQMKTPMETHGFVTTEVGND